MSQRVRRGGSTSWCLAVAVAAWGAVTGRAAEPASPAPEPQAPQLPHPWRSVTAQRLLQPEPADWASYRRSLDVTAFSPLRQINRSSVRNLRSVWSYSVPDTTSWILTPLVVNGMMYILEGGNRVVALDAASGQTIWIHERHYPDDVAMSQAYNRSRGLTMSGDAIYWGTPDAHLLALDARSGKVIWDTQTGDYHTGEGHNHPGLATGDKVFLGSAGGDRTFRGKFRAFDAQTGRRLWVTNTAPQRGEPGFETWPTRYPPLGAAPWATISYDPDLKLVYFATGQPGPWSSAQRGPGKALYSNSLLALDAETGSIRWYFQVSPAEDWDRDTAFESMLVDLVIKGRPRKALVHTGKVGWGLVLDRETGEFLHAFKTTYDSVITGWTDKGEPIIDPSKTPKPEDVGSGKKFEICPDAQGARNLNAASFSPLTRLYYVGINTSCMDGTVTPVTYSLGRNFAGAFGTSKLAPGHDYIGEMLAFDPATGERKWGYKPPGGAAMSASVLSTAGGVVFSGTIDRQFFALDDRNGKLLWQTRLNADVSGGTISYEVDGRQYIAITAGGHSIPSARYAPLTNVRIPQGSGAVWVFALPDARDLVAVGGAPRPPVFTSGTPRAVRQEAAGFSPNAPAGNAVTRTTGQGLFTTAQAAQGEATFRTACSQCHRIEDQSGDALRAKWGNGTVGELFGLISTTMPQNTPGSLSRDDYAAVLAYMLDKSGYPAGPVPLPGDASALGGVRIEPLTR